MDDKKAQREADEASGFLSYWGKVVADPKMPMLKYIDMLNFKKDRELRQCFEDGVSVDECAARIAPRLKQEANSVLGKWYE